MWDVRAAANLEDLWKIALAFLSVELSADRAVVMHDEMGTNEFGVVASRRVDPNQIWTDGKIDLAVLKRACKNKSPVIESGSERAVLCAPLVNGGVMGLLYADRPKSEDEFSPEELDQISKFADSVSKRLSELAPSPAGKPLGRPIERAEAAEVKPEPVPVAAATATLPSPSHASIQPSTAPRPSESQLIPPDASTGRRGGTLRRAQSRNDLVGGRFALQKPLLVCRFSTLYEALDRATGTPLVLRKLEGSDATSREARLQTLREGRFLARLVHRNLPKVLEVVEDGGQVYLVLEEFSGRSLEQVGVEDTLAQPLLERYLEQFLSVLEYLHTQDPPIVHRDLRPDSILVTTHGVIKLAEFGLARMRESKADPRQTSFRALGSPNYAPPEQLMGEPSAPNNDIYAVGSILYYLATGQTPVKSVDRWYGAAALTPLAEARPDLSPGLVDLIGAMMEPEFANRMGTVGEVQERFAALNGRGAVEVRPLEEEPEEESPITVAYIDDKPVEPEHRPTGLETRRITRAETARPAARKAHASPPSGVLEKLKSGAWGFLLGGKKKKEEEHREEEEPAVQFHSDLLDANSIDLSSHHIDRELGRLIPETVAKSIQGVCIGRPNSTELTVAVKDPTEIYIHDHISLATQGQYRAQLLKAEPRFIDLAMEYIYHATQFSQIPWVEWLERKSFEDEALVVANPMADAALAGDDIRSTIIDQVDRLIKEAISVGASDIHMETYEDGMELRYRIDGQLHQINNFPVNEASAMVKRLKIMANMDIAQERVTAGGRISLKVKGQELDLRVSIVPVPAGESVVMRLLKKGAFHLTLKDLGFSDHTLNKFETILSQPYGMILVCGPTGSGKSTTLYASLKQIQRPDRKLLTVEDPIEYQMPGICQVQVNMTPREEEKKVTFARVLREFLRQDPDVILVGEIRDKETAAISVQAALTGHLLLSTIHTNDSVGIVARLTDMSVEPFLIGSTLLGGLAQRLARRICPDCRDEIPVTDELKRIWEKEGVHVEPRMFKGMGCQKCHHTGHRGRVGLYELLEITTDIRNLINRAALEEELRATAAKQDFRPLYYDGLVKVSEGRVSLEEVQRVCKTI